MKDVFFVLFFLMYIPVVESCNSRKMHCGGRGGVEINQLNRKVSVCSV